MSEQKIKKPPMVNSPSELDVNNAYRATEVAYLNVFGEFPEFEMELSCVSMDVLDVFYDSPDWEIFSFDVGPTMNKSIYEKRMGEYAIPDKEKLKSGDIGYTIKFFNKDVGIFTFTESVRKYKWFGLVKIVTHRNEAAKNKIWEVTNNYLCEGVTENPRINVIKKTNDGFETRSFEVEPKEIDLHTHYEKSNRLEELHNRILENINSNEPSQSFYIFHGKPGTGKTSYIKHLMTSIDKKVIYIPPHMVNSIADPQFVDFMGDNSNSVLVIEDAEDLVEDKGQRSNALSNLLNMTDGILGDCFKMDIICTFNVNISKIDSALVRNGRLNGIFEFEELSKKKAEKLCKKVGKKKVPEKGQRTLANIFGDNEEDSDILNGDMLPRKKVGFEVKGNGNSNGKEVDDSGNEYVEEGGKNLGAAG